MSVGDLVLFTSYLRTAMKPLRDMAKYTGRISRAGASGERVADLMEVCQDIVSAPGALHPAVIGGNLEFDRVVTEYDGVEILCGRRVDTQNTHGTGCTLSSAIASLRPRRATWLEAVRDAKDYLTGAIAHAEALGVGHGRGPVHHFYRVWTRTGW